MTHQRLSLVAKVAEGTTPEMVEPEGSRSTCSVKGVFC